MKCIYWNVKGIETIERISDILVDHSPEVFFLSEIDSNVMAKSINLLSKVGYEVFENPGCERITILKKMVFDVQLSLQARYYSTIKVVEGALYIISVHLPSQMYQHLDALKGYIRDFRNEIDIVIGESTTTNILIIGDFNVSPFEKPMIDFDGFAAVNSYNSKKQITVLGKSVSSYFNPTWQLYSRMHFPGSKYFKRPSGSSYDVLEFHFLDQVLMSQLLKENIKQYKIDLIEKTTNFSFFDHKNNNIVGSDHLPLFIDFKPF